MQQTRERAMFGAGCFWGVEVAFRNLPGVVDASVGYAGGDVEHPTYEQVCTGTTGHAEVVHVTWEPDRCTFEDVLRLFFASHDATQLNRQGPDIGTQYRSVVFVASGEQRIAAESMIQRLRASGRPVVTVVEDDVPYWRAEEYHQQYLIKHGRASCRL